MAGHGEPESDDDAFAALDLRRVDVDWRKQPPREILRRKRHDMVAVRCARAAFQLALGQIQAARSNQVYEPGADAVTRGQIEDPPRPALGGLEHDTDPGRIVVREKANNPRGGVRPLLGKQVVGTDRLARIVDRESACQLPPDRHPLLDHSAR